MKNYEKYANEIREYECNNFCDGFTKPYILKKDSCDSIPSCEKCRMLQMLWLLEECKEPEEPETDWSKVEVDTPIFVRQTEDGEWIRRHFAKYEDGIVYTWKDSRTSWTVSFDEDVTGWKFAKLCRI